MSQVSGEHGTSFAFNLVAEINLEGCKLPDGSELHKIYMYVMVEQKI